MVEDQVEEVLLWVALMVKMRHKSVLIVHDPIS